MTRPLRLTGTDGRVAVHALAPEGAAGFIADEAALHLRELTGLPHAPPARAAGLAGLPRPALTLEIDPALGREAFECAEQEGLLRVRGGDPRGLYYGLMAFFESLGFRWCAPGEDGTVAPRMTPVLVERGWRAAGRPSLPWRGLHICGTGLTRDGARMAHFDHDTALWMVRNRLNFKPIHNEQYDEVFPLLDGLMLTPLAFGHSYSRWVPKELFAEHPDFFAQVAGRRAPGGQLCLSSESLREELVRRIVAFMDAHPALPVVSLAPNDGYKWCQCHACAAMDSPADSEAGELNRRHHLFTAEIARRVGALRPGRRISSISYSNYLEPAADAPRAETLAISLCITRAQNRPVDDAASASNRAYLDRTERWLAKAGEVFWSGYFLSYGGTFPRPYEQPLVSTLRALAARGVAGMKTEVVPGRYDTWRSAEFYMYLVARAMYDAQLDPEALREDFCRRYYGAAAPHCLACHRLNSARVAAYPGELKDIDATLLPELYRDADVQELLREMESAERAAAAGPPVIRRRLDPLLRQAREIADSRREAVLSLREAAPPAAPRLARAPAFEDFDRFTWTSQRIRFNRLPYPQPSRFAVAWTDDTLWLLFRLGEPDVQAAASGGPQTPDAHVWGASNVDCFISPAPETGVYFQVAANIRGAVYSARCRGREWNALWPMSPRATVRRLADRWELILGISFAEMECPAPRAGTRIRLAANRGQMCQSPSVLGGWPDGGRWHKVETLGEATLQQ
jgi:hypothetical protein